MPGAKVKDFTVTALPSAAGAKDFAAFKPGNEDDLIRCRDGERFAIHLDILDFKIAVNAARDRMGGVAHPQSLALARFAPNDGTARSHESHERLGVMRRVQRDEAHTLPYPRQNALDDCLVNFAVRSMPPPDQNVGFVEQAFGQALLRLL